MCPRCRQNAPVIYRGVMAYCTACGAPRPPLTGTSLNLVGQPSKIGGAVASVVGWIVLAGGLSLALMIGLIAQALFPAGFAGFALGIPIAALSLVIGILLVRSGKSLNRSGASAARDARVSAIFGLASHRGGALTALDVAQTLDMPADEADRLLTSLAKEDYERVAVEIDPNGSVYYRFAHAAAQPAPGAARVRVDPEIARSPNRSEWERLEREQRAQLDAEEAESAAAPPRARAARPPR
jgi:hypothetical protein